MRHRKRDDRMSRSVSLLISMLVRYPEVGTVKYDPLQQTLRINLLVNGELPEGEFEQLQDALFNTLEVYHVMEQREAAVVELQQDSYSGLTSVGFTRDVRTFSPEEIYVVIEFFRERLAGRLVMEQVEWGGEEELMAQEEMIEAMIFDLEEGRPGRNLIAIRDEGRVMVFQK